MGVNRFGPAGAGVVIPLPAQRLQIFLIGGRFVSGQCLFNSLLRLSFLFSGCRLSTVSCDTAPRTHARTRARAHTHTHTRARARARIKHICVNVVKTTNTTDIRWVSEAYQHNKHQVNQWSQWSLPTQQTSEESVNSTNTTHIRWIREVY